MNFKSVVESLSTVTDLKRVASAYVIDYRNLSNDEVTEALLKTAPQYYFRENVEATLKSLMLSENRDERIIAPIIINQILLHTDDFKISQKELTDSVIEYEQRIVNESNEFKSNDKSDKGKNLDFYKFALEVAWDKDESISPDEKNLLDKIRIKLGITEDEKNIIEASIGRFPLDENKLHTRNQIEAVRRKLQSSGLLFSVRNGERVDFDVIPEEIASVLKSIYGYEMKYHCYVEMVNNKHLKNKKYLQSLLEKAGVEMGSSLRMDDLKSLCLAHLKPSELLGGFSPRDGLDSSELSKWCAELHLAVSGQKGELIQRIVEFYDNIRKEIKTIEDERVIWYEFYEDIAARRLDSLRSQNVIVKDLECEKYFEGATDYIFEEMFMHKPLVLKGTEHADGMLAYQDKIIMWDNKSKESDVNLADHIKQFDRYIANAEKKVPIFLVIGPSFTESSTAVAMQYMLENDTVMCLITASELKDLASKWSTKSTEGGNPFPLGYFKQPGRFNVSLVTL